MRLARHVGAVQNKKRIHELADAAGVETTKVLTTRARGDADAGDFVQLRVERPLKEIVSELRDKGML